MSTASFLRLLLLSAIWGGSFLLIRVGAPALGPVTLMEARVLLAAIFLAAVALALRLPPLDWRAHWRHYLVIGLLNSALPFLLFGYAALSLPASLLSILNATSPLWGTLIGALWQRAPLDGRRLAGLALGIVGVGLLVGFDRVALNPGAGLAIAASLAAALCYAMASSYAKSARAVAPFANAHGSMWAASLLIAPLLAAFPPAAAPAPGMLALVAALGVLCSGIAYLLYFRLIEDIGAAPALTVTFLIPLFGSFFGWLVLGETIGWHTLAGGAVVIVGTALVTGFSPGMLMWRKEAASA
ncbi:MAG: DMT family transporter [Rhodocyclales bacterium]|nr:DMT family transporter [Rhodocyclales bacterium]